jgi:hypothetical protein
VKLGHAAEVQSRTVCANIRHLEKVKSLSFGYWDEIISR